jgi:putative SOS response-associated peptidase YedK
MCGRISISSDTLDPVVEWALIYGKKAPPKWKPLYNLGPGMRAPVVFEKDAKRLLHLMKWGLVPFWAKDEKIGYKTSNARSEGITEKPSYRNAVKSRRCFIPVDGFYEWKAVPDPAKPKKLAKQPYRMVPREGAYMALAGLWECWDKGDEPLETFTIITCAPNKLMSAVHDRMPVILQDEEARQQWLSPETPLAEALKLLLPATEGFLRAYEVSTLVNSMRINDPQVIEPL